MNKAIALATVLAIATPVRAQDNYIPPALQLTAEQCETLWGLYWHAVDKLIELKGCRTVRWNMCIVLTAEYAKQRDICRDVMERGHCDTYDLRVPTQSTPEEFEVLQ